MNLLFSSRDMSELQNACLESAVRAADRFTEVQLRSNSVAKLVQAAVDECVPAHLEVNFAGKRVSREQVNLPAVSTLEVVGITRPGALPALVPGLQIDLHIPYTGHQDLLIVTPTQRSSRHPQVSMVHRDRLVLSFTSTGEDDPAELPALIAEQEAELGKWVGWLNTDLDNLERMIREKATAQINQRISLLNIGDQVLATLNIPIFHVDADQALELPIRPRPVAPTPLSSGSKGQLEWTLSETIYEATIRTITGFTRALERRPPSARTLIPDEETLRDWVLFMLDANYRDESDGEVFVGGEVVNGAGKTDILVRHEGANVFIGECKFWDGPTKFDEAIEQLLSYTVWRDTKAALIPFITRKDATAIIEKADERLRAHPQFRAALQADDPVKRRDYRFASPDDNQRMITLALLPVVVPRNDAA